MSTLAEVFSYTGTLVFVVNLDMVDVKDSMPGGMELHHPEFPSTRRFVLS